MEKDAKLRILVFASVVVVLLALLLGWMITGDLGEKIVANNQQTSEISDDIETGLVSKVLDGDTVELSNKRRVKYIGVVAPKKQCFDVQATQKNSELVLNKTIRLEKDASNRDKSGKLLRYVYVNFENREIMVNDYLLSYGYVRLLSIPPDLKFERQFNISVNEANFQDRGLWASCPNKT